MPHFYISAGIQLAEGADLQLAEQGLRHLIQQTQEEPGCISFEIRQNQKDRTKFTLWECWTDPDALAAHFDADHTKKYLAQNLTTVSYIEELGPISGIAAEQNTVSHP
ncbi:MAG: putative quinol monooxygenase [Roseibium sp.]